MKKILFKKYHVPGAENVFFLPHFTVVQAECADDSQIPWKDFAVDWQFALVKKYLFRIVEDVIHIHLVGINSMRLLYNIT